MPARALDINGLYGRHCDDLLVFLMRRTADVEIARDLWAETFAQAVLTGGRFRGTTDAEAGAWLFGIARNLLLRYYRRGAVEQRALRKLGMQRPELTPEVEGEIMRRAELSELRAELRAALSTLSDDVRAAITMRVIDELPYSDIAGRLAISEGAARSRVSRGLQLLSEALDHTTIAEGLPS